MRRNDAIQFKMQSSQEISIMRELCSLTVDFIKTWRTLPVLPWIRAARLHRAGQHDAARHLYEQGLERNPTHPAAFCARLDLAHCLLRGQHFSDAEGHLRLLTLQRPDDRTPYIHLVKSKMWQGHFHEAGLMAIRSARRLHPDPELVGLALWCFMSARSCPELVKEVLSVEKLLPSKGRKDNVLPQGVLGWYWYVQGEYRGGIAELRRVSSFGQQSVEVMLAFAEVLLDAGQVGQAREQLHRALGLRPGYPLTLSLLSQCYLDPDLYEPHYAVQLATEACRASGWRSARFLHILAEALTRTGEYSTAMMMAQKARHEARRVISQYPELAALEELLSDLDSRNL